MFEKVLNYVLHALESNVNIVLLILFIIFNIVIKKIGIRIFLNTFTKKINKIQWDKSSFWKRDVLV